MALLEGGGGGCVQWLYRTLSCFRDIGISVYLLTYEPVSFSFNTSSKKLSV